MELGAGFRRLWWATATSDAGSAIGYGALPLVAVLTLHASTPEVSLLAAVSASAGALIAVPSGAAVEFRRKRPVMVAADIVRFAALTSVAVATALHVVTMAQLYAVSVIQTAALVTFQAASGAHLRSLVPKEKRAEALSRLDTSSWTANALGPPIGGTLVSAVGPALTLAIDAVSYLASVLGVSRIRQPEPPPPARKANNGKEIVAGWRYLLGDRALRLLFANALLFGSSMLMVVPLETVLMLNVLHVTPWQYGLVVGLPCLGGVLGARLSPRLVRRFGLRRVLLGAGIARTPWLLAIPLAAPGLGGLILLMATSFGLLLCAGVFNPAFTAHRMAITREDMMSRVLAGWSVGGRLTQPLFIAAGGALATVTSLRTAIAVAGILCVTSIPFLLRSGGRSRVSVRTRTR